MQRHMINSHGVVMLIFNQWGEEKSHHIKIPDPLKWINSFPSRVPLQHYQAAIFFKPFKISIMCEWSFASNLMAVFSCNKVEEMLILLAGVFYETWHSKIKCHVRLNLCQSSLWAFDGIINGPSTLLHRKLVCRVQCNKMLLFYLTRTQRWILFQFFLRVHLLTVMFQHNGCFHYVFFVHWTNINARIL